MKRIVWLLLSYWRTRRLRFASRAQLDAYQQRQLARFIDVLCARSTYFAPYRKLPLAQWPTMNKALMLEHFDAMNTEGITLAQAMEAAMAAEHSRDFTPAVGDITVGLSSGTSSRRAVFTVSPREKAQWAGVMLAKALPDGLFSGEKVALFLRANSNLYTAVRSPWLTFAFYDLFQPFDSLCAQLARYQPSVIVAPAQVLRQLALRVIEGSLVLAPKKVISVAEVLEAQDRALIVQAFGAVHEIYQATEGFLASSCEHGVLHLNEEYVHIEPQWLDDEQRRFVPVITDFTRITQPIVRYRLDDILIARATPCPCGRTTRAIDGIEGRCDDMLLLPSLPSAQSATVAVFADVLTRAFAQALPADADYRLLQSGDSALQLHAALDDAGLAALRAHLATVLRGLGVAVDGLAWTTSGELPPFDPTMKRRRIRRLATA
ncbi:CoF synthetase [Janthinobacterium sp. GW460P]|uniref:F390 synthetase-related protein n=1 Tax=unclassified Janthinobacterium TaxID=2610881 RepID=UPI000A320B6D|nr:MULTISPECIES: F390 synthetase-related protein [unclassified Janthinobacterium]MCC7701804.1 CoF synthetase [Janthinobacterium sp. GW460P]MCC7707312.1 CoF synthetase [Janthinobacterium sp. GW460W]